MWLVFPRRNTMASNGAVLVAVSKLNYLQFITIGTSTFLNEHFQLVYIFI